MSTKMNVYVTLFCVSMFIVSGNIWGAEILPALSKKKQGFFAKVSLAAKQTKNAFSRKKKNKVAPDTLPIAEPGLLAGQQRFMQQSKTPTPVDYRKSPKPPLSAYPVFALPTKENTSSKKLRLADAGLTLQARQASPGYPPVLLAPVYRLHVGSPSSPGALSPLSPAPSSFLSSSSSESETPASSGRSDRSGLSSVSPASPASPAPLASSPDRYVVEQQPVVDVAAMLKITTSPAIIPTPDEPTLQEFMLPGAAQSEKPAATGARVLSAAIARRGSSVMPECSDVVEDEEVREKEGDFRRRTSNGSGSRHVSVGSLGELPDNLDGQEYDDEFGHIDFDELAVAGQVDIIPAKPVTMKDLAALRQSDIREIASQDDAWTPLMWAANTGDLEKIRSMEFTYDDIKDGHGQPGKEKTYALELARKGRDAIMRELEKNPIAYLEEYDEDFLEVVERYIQHNKSGSDTEVLFNALELQDLFNAVAKDLDKRIKELGRKLREEDLSRRERREYSSWITRLEIASAKLNTPMSPVQIIEEVQSLYKEYQEYEQYLKNYVGILQLFSQKILEDCSSRNEKLEKMMKRVE
ncbi:MAG: hypothetical protein ACHQVS_02295 [Candidatus Babeliales bacterium]